MTHTSDRSAAEGDERSGSGTGDGRDDVDAGMDVLIHRGRLDWRLERRPVPTPRAGDDVVVRTLAVGVCGTDRGIYLGHYRARTGVIPGHEAVGMVQEIGPAVSDVSPGMTVVLNPTLWCGGCDPCQQARTNLCVHKEDLEVGVVRDGALAQRFVVPARALHVMPPDATLESAVLTEPLACVLNGARAVGLVNSDQVLVLGGGPIGLLWTVIAERFASSALLVERDARRRALAAGRVRICGPDDLDDYLDDQPSVVVDTTGGGLEWALELVADAGRVLLMGRDAAASAVVSPLALTARGITVVGAADYDAYTFPIALRLAVRLGCDWMVTHRVPLREHRRAMELLATGPDASYGALKVIFVPK